VVFVTAGTAADPVRLEHLAMTGGDFGVQTAPAVHWAMTDCTVRDNRGGDNSQGLLNFGTLTLTRCQLRDNGPAMGPTSAPGGGLQNNGTATLIECCVTGNRQLQGGGIVNSGTLTLTDTRVFGNTATESGGGLFNIAPEANVTISGSTVICHNTAASNSNCAGLSNAACGASPCPTSCSA
jgi:hypothetical protein